MAEARPLLTDPDVLETLAHPVRLDVLTYLIADGPATASQCARAVGDTPSNCSYHVRMLARHGLVEPVAGDRRAHPALARDDHRLCDRLRPRPGHSGRSWGGGGDGGVGGL